MQQTLLPFVLKGECQSLDSDNIRTQNADDSMQCIPNSTIDSMYHIEEKHLSKELN